MTCPVGVDDLVSDCRLPETMICYQTRGIPEMVIIDKKREIRFQYFGSFNPIVIKKLINILLSE